MSIKSDAPSPRSMSISFIDFKQRAEYYPGAGGGGGGGGEGGRGGG